MLARDAPLHPARIRIYVRPETSIVVATWDTNSDGTSITNAVEIVAAAVAKEYGLERLTWIEHYEHGGDDDETFDLVRFHQEEFRNPAWQHLGSASLLELLGSGPS